MTAGIVRWSAEQRCWRSQGTREGIDKVVEKRELKEVRAFKRRWGISGHWKNQLIKIVALGDR